MPECLKCGKCCVIWTKKEFISCEFLGKDNLCTIFNVEGRIGKRIGHQHFCNERKYAAFDYPGCPYNSGKPIHPAYTTG